MIEYLLVQNPIYDVKHVVQRRWWHKIFGNPKLTLDAATARTSIEATVIFKKRGHSFGYFNEQTLINWHKNKPKLFAVVLAGAVAIKAS